MIQMDAIINIMTRRSVRSFDKRSITKDELKLITDAAKCAPSGMNKQLWHFSVIQNKDVLKRLASATSKAMSLGDSYDFYSPDTLIIASNERSNPHGAEDCACALENIFLAANSLGIGSVWINQLRHVCDEESVRAMLNEIGVPGSHVVYGCAALGYAKTLPPTPIKKADVVSWIL